MTSRSTRRPRRALATVLATATVALASLTALPQGASAQSASPRFVLAGQSPWVAPGAPFVLRFSAADVPPGAQVAITTHDDVQSRSRFDASVDGSNLPATRDRRTFAYDTLVVDPSTGDRLLAYPIDALREGVFPMEVDLRSASEESLARFVTHMVVAPVGADGTLAVGQPLNVAWVWPLHAEPGHVAGGFNPTTVADVGPAGRLGRQAAQLGANVDVPLTLAPSPETLEAWGAFIPELAEGPEAIRSTIGRNQILAEPFVPLDLPAMERGGLGGLVNPGLTRGVATLENFFGPQVVDTTTALPGPLDGESLRLLLNASRRQLVLDGDALTPVDERFTPNTHPFKMRAVEGDDSSAVTVVATDPGLEQFLSGDDPPALRAAHLLAGLAVVAREQPSIARGIAITNPADWDADGTFVNDVLTGLRANPLLRPVTVRDLIAAVPTATVDDEPDGEPVYRQLAPNGESPAPPVTPAQYAAGFESTDAVRRLVGPTDPATTSAERSLASSVSAEWANPTGRIEARRLLAGIRTLVETYLRQVEVQERGTITITSSKAEIPIGFRNTSHDDITVRLRLASDRLLFPDGAERDVLLPARRTTTVQVPVETRGSGTAPVRMTVTTADGLPIPESNRIIEVRSTFVSGVGVFLTVGAIVFLALWWGWDIHRRRKKRARGHDPTYPLGSPSGQPA